MSNIGIAHPFPVALVLAGAVHWPVTLGITIIAAITSTVAPCTWVRVTGAVITGVLAAMCLNAVWVTAG